MFTLLMSLGLVGLVVVSGFTFSRRMDELFDDTADAVVDARGF